MPRKHVHRWKLDEHNFGHCRCKAARQFSGGFPEGRDAQSSYVWSLRFRREGESEMESGVGHAVVLRLER